jgi:hypothetical protein
LYICQIRWSIFAFCSTKQVSLFNHKIISHKKVIKVLLKTTSDAWHPTVTYPIATPLASGPPLAPHCHLTGTPLAPHWHPTGTPLAPHWHPTGTGTGSPMAVLAVKTFFNVSEEESNPFLKENNLLCLMEVYEELLDSHW